LLPDNWIIGLERGLDPVPRGPTVPIRTILASGYNGSMPFAIRDYEPADFETLWRIDQDCFPPGISYSRAELKFYMRRRGSFTVLAVESAQSAAAAPHSGTGKRDSPRIPLPNGVAGFLVAEGDRGSGHIITIDVLGAARRSGVGSLLLRAAEDRLRAAQCRSVELETAVGNLSALSFYKRHGYDVIKTFPRYYSNGVDALVLEKELGSFS
jgi:[ribosomal protein S18]-alanine N-acetyltransferase